MPKTQNKTLRVDKYLSSMGLTSRRNVKTFLKFNNVRIDGKKVTEPGERFNPKISKMEYAGKTLKTPKKVYFMLNKPKGIITTVSDEFGRKNVLSLVKTPERIYPIGRLDKDTHGLLLLTNDGDLTNLLIHPRYHIEKTYQLTIRGQIFAPQIEKLKSGVMLDDGITKTAKIQIIQKRKDATVFTLTLSEGKKRQIRRMCEALKLPLVDLQRIKLGPLSLDNLRLGEYRSLTPKEVELLKNITAKQNAIT